MAGEIRPLDEDIGHLEMENQQAIDDVKRPSDAQKPEFTVYQVRQRLRLRFTGTGGEYFRIWIVNLFLTVLTLGILFRLDTFAAAEQSAESAIGEAATGFFDIDIGL